MGVSPCLCTHESGQFAVGWQSRTCKSANVSFACGKVFFNVCDVLCVLGNVFFVCGNAFCKCNVLCFQFADFLVLLVVRLCQTAKLRKNCVKVACVHLFFRVNTLARHNFQCTLLRGNFTQHLVCACVDNQNIDIHNRGVRPLSCINCKLLWQHSLKQCVLHSVIHKVFEIVQKVCLAYLYLSASVSIGHTNFYCCAVFGAVRPILHRNSRTFFPTKQRIFLHLFRKDTRCNNARGNIDVQQFVLERILVQRKVLFQVHNSTACSKINAYSVHFSTS